MLILKGHKGSVHEISFSPDGTKLVSAGRDGTARLWDLFTGKQIGCLNQGSCVNTVSFSGNGRTVAVGGCKDRILLWDIRKVEIQELAVFPSPEESDRDWRGQRIGSVAFSPSGKNLIATASRGISGWNWKKGHWHLAWNPPLSDGCIACSPDGLTFATGSILNSANFSNAIDFWKIRNCEYVGKIRSRKPYDSCTSLAYSPDGALLAGACGRDLVVGDISTLKECFTYQSGGTHFQSAAFSPDNQVLAAVNNDKSVRTWDTTTWKPGNTYDWEIGKLLDIAYAPDGMRAAACSNTGKIIIWDIVT